ncbi:hypothetical protein [Mycobacterium sp. E796]|uniref:hypothetical protein n=1 Tax=Mycobacterium sp. E796 TaxID=1834151 RepID=UPI000AA4C7B5|nr:hypothetical protein [Mycobacterium sp. E796]
MTTRAETRPDNRLALLDQGFYAGHCAVGQQEVMQIVWLYEHAIDFDGLRRFHHNLRHGLLGRLIERSPLPFGRHRWVLDRGPSEIDIAEAARPRAELSDWADERSQLPVDPEAGPGWHLGVLPLTDGSTAVTLVASHYVLDGIGLLIAAIEAMLGQTRDLGYPPPGSRTRLRAVVEDSRQTARDVPEVARALVAFARLARRQRRDAARAAPAGRPVTHSGGDDPVILPGTTILVDLDQWDARAQALGGSSNTLAAGFTAKLAEHLGRRRSGDGAVTLQVVKSDRTEGDTRAVAVSFARVRIDPTRVTTDLREARAAIKQALRDLRDAPDLASQLAALTPFTPKRTWRRGVDAALNDPDLPVVCSHLGDVGFSVGLLDGTHCDYAWARGTRQHVTRQWMEETGGHLQVLSFSSPGLGKVCIHVVTYQPGAVTTKAALRELASRTLAEFDLSGQID